jgi:hypothetical protein
MTKFSDWPQWLQVLVVAPTAVLLTVMLCWWPKDAKGWKRFWIMAAYLLLFYLVMHFVFRL